METAQEQVKEQAINKVPKIALKSFIIDGSDKGDEEVSNFLSTINNQDRRLHTVNYIHLNGNDVLAVVMFFDLEDPSPIEVVKFGKK